MANEFIIKNGFHSKGDSQVTGSLDVSGAILSNGSQLGAPFPFIGDARITGSLTISGSFNSFTLDSDNIVLGSGSGVAMQESANNNVILGTNTADSLTTGDQNVAIGHQALQALTGNSGNTAIGFEAAKSYTNANSIFIGYRAGLNWSTGNDNVVIGKDAADAHTSGATNVYIGYSAAGGGVGGGSYNLAIGGNAGSALSTGTNNVALGKNAGFNLNQGTENIAIGTNALDSIAGGEYNIAIGYYAGASLDQDDGNIMIGFGSAADGTTNGELKIGSGSITTIYGDLATGDLTFPSTASADYFAGNGSQLTNLPASDPFPFTGDASITGSLSVSGSVNINDSLSNIIISTVGSASSDNTAVTGNHNIVMGMSAAEDLGASSDNIIIGNRAASGSVFSATKGKNIIIGTEAGSDADMVDSANVVYIGYQAGFESTGASSVFVGASAGKYADGNENVAVGGGAMTSNAANGGTPLYNVAMGNYAMSHLWDGNNNVAIGHSAMRNPQQYYNTSTGTVAIGSSAIRNNRKNNYTVGAGYQSLYNLRGDDTDSGNHVTAIGAFAGFSEQFGYNHTLLGYRAGYDLTASTGSIVIGFDAASGTSYMDHQLFIGSGSSAIISGSLTTGNIIFPSTASAEYFVGNGSQLTGISSGVQSITVDSGIIDTGNASIPSLGVRYTTTVEDNNIIDGASTGTVVATTDTILYNDLDAGGNVAKKIAINELPFTNNAGTITSVTGTAPVVSSGGTTPAISMAAASTSANGYLTSTDWNTFNNKTSNAGTVTKTGTPTEYAIPAWTNSSNITTSVFQIIGNLLKINTSVNKGMSFANSDDGESTFLSIPANDTVVLKNTTANGTVAINANTSTAGTGGDTQVALFSSTLATFYQKVNLNSVVNAGTDTDKFLVLDSANDVDFRTGAEVLSDIGAVTSANGSDNRVATFSSATALNGESDLTFNGTTLETSGTMEAGKFIVNATNGPEIDIEGAAGFNMRHLSDDQPMFFLTTGSGTTGVINFGTNGTNSRVTITSTGALNPKVSLAVGAITPSTTVGRIDAANDVVAFSSSDKKLKENIKPIKNALDKVSQISGVEFDWKELTEDEKLSIHGNEGHDVGVIAQEIEKVLPEVVQTRDNGYKAVKYEKIVPLLIESIKELKAEIEELKKSK
tara:strand:+ start:347 stop:3811 length:3465 start_codon:yes stop_codon:yes gene_type:complete